MKKIKNFTHSDTFWPVVASLALMVALLLLPTGFEGALSYQNADRVSALVLSTDESDIYDTGLVRTGDQRCRVRILGGQFAGTETEAVNRLSGSLAQDKLFSAGEKAFVVVSHSGDEITTVYMTDHFRLGKEAVLAGLFLLLLLVFARGTGLRAILSFIDTILLMWKVLVPSLLNGYNPVWVSLCLVMVLTALILMLIYGWDRRFLAAVSGAALGILVTAVLGAGYILYTMNVRKGLITPYTTLFDGFLFAGKIILLEIVQYIFVFLWSLLFIIPGIIAGYRYRFALYNLCENPEMGVMEALNMSKAQTRGHKWELFVLDLSFLGWIILCGLTLDEAPEPNSLGQTLCCYSLQKAFEEARRQLSCGS